LRKNELIKGMFEFESQQRSELLINLESICDEIVELDSPKFCLPRMDLFIMDQNFKTNPL